MSSLVVLNDTVAEAVRAFDETDAPVQIHRETAIEKKRNRLKQELAHAAITHFHPTLSSPSQLPVDGKQAESSSAEDIMKQLEKLHPLPILRPATHPSINANWSFVFTGVPTIGMKLITLLSRISMGLPFEILDFREVGLMVSDRQTKAKAVVEVKVCGAWEWVLEVCTNLRRPTEEDLRGDYEKFKGEEGTLLLEHFQGIRLNGEYQ